jgi:hypothetical protein
MNKNLDKTETNELFSTFYVLSTIEGYSGHCGGKSSGVEEHDSIKDALEMQLDWLDSYGFDDEDAIKQKTTLENTITLIKDGKDIIPQYLSYSDGRTQYITHAAGYWDTFVHDALPFFKDDVNGYLKEFAEGDEDSEVIEFRRQLAIIEILMNRKDIRSDEFVDAFIGIKEDYVSRHC